MAEFCTVYNRFGDVLDKRTNAMSGYAFNYEGISSHRILGVVIEQFWSQSLFELEDFVLLRM